MEENKKVPTSTEIMELSVETKNLSEIIEMAEKIENQALALKKTAEELGKMKLEIRIK